MKKTLGLTFLVCALLAARSIQGALVFGQIDDFQDGTTMSWGNGGAVPQPANIANGGPGGAGDRYLQVTSDGVGAGGRLTVFNRSQWLGDYIGQGVTGIEMDLNNFSNVSLTLRIAFKSATFNGAPGYLSQPFVLAAGSGWQHFTFSITAATMIPVGGPSAFNAFFNNGMAEMRIINEAGTTNLNGDPVVGQIGIDNVRAVPEPQMVSLIAVTGLLFVLRRMVWA